ncbi:hypothetical protein IOD13_16255 [Brevibacterium casei]|nr:hypothetical protein [Brevibacterium casei]
MPALATPAARPRGTDGLRDTGELRDADEFRDTDEGITGLAVCTAITANTRDVITIELWTPWLNRADFEPGQYLTVHVPELGLDRPLLDLLGAVRHEHADDHRQTTGGSGLGLPPRPAPGR